ncbi:MAG: hypothetical protein ACREF4_08320, partial [Gammaproteobacteria bacterium]
SGIGADIVTVSPYKVFGPHMGMVAATPEVLDTWDPYRVRPAEHYTSPERWETGTQNHEAMAGFVAAVDYLAEIGESLPLYADQQVAHPGWLLRDANRVLSANVRLGPWIHVESVTQHHGVVHDGESVTTRARVTREWGRKGHRFVELDVGTLDGDRLVARVVHTAIYRPRPQGA